MSSGRKAVASTYRSAPLLLNLEQKCAPRPDSTTAQPFPLPGTSNHGEGWLLASTWCNLGLWPEASSRTALCTFREACEALAVAVGEAAHLGPGDVVLDVGVGYADQTAVWASRFGVGRVIGVELSADHVVAARAAQAEGRLAGAGVVELHLGSANALPVCCEAPKADGTFDAVLCLDCAYHFRTRAAFLSSAGRLLKVGGTFAAADLVVSDDDDDAHQLVGTRDARTHSTFSLVSLASLTRWWLGVRWRRYWRRAVRRFVAILCDIPPSNLHGLHAYRASLEASGLDEAISVQPISERVLEPFAAHAKRQHAALKGELTTGESISLWLIGALFSFVARHRLFEVVIISARRSPRALGHTLSSH